jgi:hypothetical protein
MSTIEKQDVVTTGLAYLIDLWKNKPILRGILESHLTEIQNLEDVVYKLLTERGVYIAAGAQLDRIGVIVGEKRNSRLDPIYRQAILRRIAINSSDGTQPIILDILNAVSESPIPNIFEHYPATLYAYIDRNPSHILATILNESSAAGVDVALLFDKGANSFVPATIIPNNKVLKINGAKALSVRKTEFQESMLGITEDQIITTGTRSYLPSALKTETINPPCRVISDTDFQTESFYITVNEELFNTDSGVLTTYEASEI